VTQRYEAPQGEIEEALAAIWQELLHVERVGRHDNFFELGGYSLLAVELISRMRGTLNHELKLREFFSLPTIHDLAHQFSPSTATLSNNEAEKSQVDIRLPVLLRTGEEIIESLFFIHAASGDVLPFAPLAQRLHANYPIYGVQLDPECPLISIEILASQHIEQIRAIQSHGPYRIAGWSFGALVAYEIAYQLLGADETIEFVGLIDPIVPDGKSSVGLVGSDVSMLLVHLRTAAISASESELQEIEQSTDLQAAVNKCKQSGFLPATLAIHEIRTRIDHMRTLVEMSHRYQPPCLPVPVSIFAAEEALRQGESRDWTQFVHPRSRTILIGGSHASIMKLPHMDTLATGMSDAIASARPACANFEPYLPLIDLGTARPESPQIFCVPGTGQGPRQFQHLAGNMGVRAELFSFLPAGMENDFVPHSSIQAAAYVYLTAIRKASRSDQYRILGCSIGGWIAIEMARQLTAFDGVSVEPVILFDTLPPTFPSTEQRTLDHLGILLRFVQDLSLETGKVLNVERGELEFLDNDSQMDMILRRGIESGALRSGTSIAVLRKLVRVITTQRHMTYAPPNQYTGKVIAVYSAEYISRMERHDAPALLKEWKKHTSEITLVEMQRNLAPSFMAEYVTRFWGLPK
jgi:thioesterase domain-containing protein